MKKLIITDLMGTLLDAICITNPNESCEYQSKLKAVCRKLNVLLEQQKEIIILTDYSHTTIEYLKKVLNDMYNEILDSNKDRVKFMVTGIKNKEGKRAMLNKDSQNIIAVNNRLELFDNKDLAYEHIIDSYRGYAIVAVDDHPYNNNGFTILFMNGHKTCGILNDYGSRSLGPEICQNDEFDNYAWSDGYRRYLEAVFPTINLENCLNKIYSYINYKIFKTISDEDYYEKGNKYWEEYEKEIYKLIERIAAIKQCPSNELLDDYQKVKKDLNNSKYENDFTAILNVLTVQGKFDLYDLYAASAFFNNNVYKDFTNEELIEGYLQRLINPCVSFRDAYEKVLLPF